MKRLIISLISLLALAAGLQAAKYGIEDIPNVQIADKNRLVSNPDGLLSAAAESRINSQLLDIRNNTTAEVAMVVIDSIADGENIDDFATELFETWGLGNDKIDNGLLILVVPGERKYAIRTGYGVEGVLPDVVLARLVRREMTPRLKANDLDGGLLALTNGIHEAMTNPEVLEQLKAESEDSDSLNWSSIFSAYAGFSLVGTLLIIIVAMAMAYSNRRKSNYEKYVALKPMQRISGALCFFLLAMPLVVYVPLRLVLNHWRNGRHECPNCGTNMVKQDEDKDNEYLTPAQDTEEKLNSVDYDVWLCPKCGEKDIYAFVNQDTTYTECPHCHARACRLYRDRVVQKPTTQHEGVGVKEYRCANCKQISQIPYKIAKLASPAVVILPGGGGGGFGGGGSIGGGFGGGSTGGGGVSGGW